MKNLLKVFGIIALAAVMGFSFSACSTDGGGGEDEKGKTLTITGLEAYEGKYIHVIGYGLAPQDGDTISIQSYPNEKVVGGKVTLTMVIYTRNGSIQADTPPYQGTDNNVTCILTYTETAEPNPSDTVSSLASITADFSAGNATVAYPAE